MKTLSLIQCILYHFKWICVYVAQSMECNHIPVASDDVIHGIHVILKSTTAIWDVAQQQDLVKFSIGCYYCAVNVTRALHGSLITIVILSTLILNYLCMSLWLSPSYSTLFNNTFLYYIHYTLMMQSLIMITANNIICMQHIQQKCSNDIIKNIYYIAFAIVYNVKRTVCYYLNLHSLA